MYYRCISKTIVSEIPYTDMISIFAYEMKLKFYTKLFSDINGLSVQLSLILQTDSAVSKLIS